LTIAQLHKSKKILLVGAGKMSRDYLEVLLSLRIKPTVVCRKKASAVSFYKKTGYEAAHGDLVTILNQEESSFEMAIVAVDVVNLYSVTKILLLSGISKVLVEKPGGISSKEINNLDLIATEKNADLLIAYNRRFYSSTQKAKEIIQLDGGSTSFLFEFTEWSHTIAPLEKPMKEKERWLLANSSHVIDLAFFLGGQPRIISCHRGGKNRLEWHPMSSVFSGSGVAENDALFSYHANWAAPGRWKVEILTKRNRMILEPLEGLLVQKIGSVEKSMMEIDNQKDLSFKPGLFNQVKAFVNNDLENFCTISEQRESMKVYNKISNYNI